MSHSPRRMSCPGPLRGGILVAILLLAATPVAAANRDTQEREARKACLKGDYGKGVDILVDLFVDTKDPTYIFNQGRCFEQNRRYEDAIGRFQEYLRASDTKLSPQDRAAAEKHISECRGNLARERGDATPSPQGPPPPPPTNATASGPSSEAASTPEPAPSIVAQHAREPAQGQRRWGLLTAGIASGAAGVAGLLTGVILNLKANQMASDMETNPGGYSSGKESDQKTYKTMSAIGCGAGAACLAAGAIFVLLGLRTTASSTTDVALLPAVGPGQAGALLKGGF